MTSPVFANQLPCYIIASHGFGQATGQTFYPPIYIYIYKPGPPRFARSTILVISPSHLPNKTLKEFISQSISKLYVTQYACAKCNITTLLAMNSFQSMQYITAMYKGTETHFNIVTCIISTSSATATIIHYLSRISNIGRNSQ